MTTLSNRPLRSLAEGRHLLVTGAGSQIGLGVLAQAGAMGWRVTAISRSRPAMDGAVDGAMDRAVDGGVDGAVDGGVDGAVDWDGVDWLPGDLAADRLDLADRRIDAVIHTTGLWLLPAHLAAFHGAGARTVVAFGSTSIIAKRTLASGHERAVITALAAAADRVAETCASLGLAYTILMPTLVYGRGLDRNIALAARVIARTGWFPLAMRADGLRQPVHADDVAAVALGAAAAGNSLRESYFLGGGEVLPYREMIGRIFDCLGRPRRRLPVPGLSPILDLVGRVTGRHEINGAVARRMAQDQVFDHGPAVADFGYAPRPFLSGGRADLGM